MCNLIPVSSVKTGLPDGIIQQVMPFSGVCFYSSNGERFFLSHEGALKDKKERFRSTRNIILSLEGFIALVEENYAGDYETVMSFKNRESLNPCYRILQNFVVGKHKILKVSFVESVFSKNDAEKKDVTEQVLELSKQGVFYIKTIRGTYGL